MVERAAAGRDDAGQPGLPGGAGLPEGVAQLGDLAGPMGASGEVAGGIAAEARELGQQAMGTVEATARRIREIVQGLFDDGEPANAEAVAADPATGVASDGWTDAVIIEDDADGNGVVDTTSFVIDDNGNGTPDTIYVEIDQDEDGVVDAVAIGMDSDEDGDLDGIAVTTY